MHAQSATGCQMVSRVLHCFFGLLTLLLFTVSAGGTASGAGTSPYRAFYPHIKTISAIDLYEGIFDKTIIDVRSPFEFNVVHINTSINLPLAAEDFADRLFKLKDSQEDIEVVFVGNDVDCSRAFDAARTARLQGMSNVSVFDAGVFAWLHAYPEKTRLMGDLPAHIERVLPLVQHQIHLASYDRFKTLAMNPGVLVIDIRNIYRRRSVPQGLEVRNIVLDALLQAVGNRIWAERPLLIFDSDGSKTRWLQLYLQAGGFYNYQFLEGGLDAIPEGDLSPVSGGRNDTVSINQKYLKEALGGLKKADKSADFFTYILSSVRLKNLAFISAEAATADLGISAGQLLQMSDQLAATGLIRFFQAEGNLIFQVDPLVVWKEEMAGMQWQESVGQFHNHHRD